MRLINIEIIWAENGLTDRQTDRQTDSRTDAHNHCL